MKEWVCSIGGGEVCSNSKNMGRVFFSLLLLQSARFTWYLNFQVEKLYSLFFPNSHLISTKNPRPTQLSPLYLYLSHCFAQNLSYSFHLGKEVTREHPKEDRKLALFSFSNTLSLNKAGGCVACNENDIDMPCSHFYPLPSSFLSVGENKLRCIIYLPSPLNSSPRVFHL